MNGHVGPKALSQAAPSSWDELLAEYAPEFHTICERLWAPDNGSPALDPKMRQLVLLSVNASTCHLQESAVRTHIRAALQHGASKAEILEVLQLTSALGFHTWTIGIPHLVEALRAGGHNVTDAALDERQTRLKAEFIAKHGGWSDYWNSILVLATDFFEATMEMLYIPWAQGPLLPKQKELIYVAIDAATNHLYERGIRIHMAKALKSGATVAEIIEVLRLASSLGSQTLAIGLPILAEELGRGGFT